MNEHQLKYIFDKVNIVVYINHNDETEQSLNELYVKTKDPFDFLEKSLKVAGVNVVGTNSYPKVI